MKILNLILRILAGLTFVFSGVSKLYPVESFELTLVDSGLINWYVTPYLSRLFISFECVLGIFILLNINIKTIIKITIGLLSFFTIYLVYIWIKDGENADCGCFGELIQFSIKESILKNIILLIISFFIFKSASSFKIKFQKIIAFLIVIGLTSFPFIVNPINYENYSVNSTNYELKLEKLDSFVYQNIEYNLKEGKKIICFFSLSCKFCKLAAKKITIINKKLDKNLPVFYVLGGSKKYLEEFWTESNSNKFPYLLLEPSAENNKIFFDLSGPILPTIYLTDNGVVKKKIHFENIEQSEIENFLNK